MLQPLLQPACHACRNEEYGLLNPKAGSADAVCIVLSKRLNPDVFKIFKACVDAGKVCSHYSHTVQEQGWLRVQSSLCAYLHAHNARHPIPILVNHQGHKEGTNTSLPAALTLACPLPQLVFFVVTYSENEADLSGDMEMLAEKKKQRFADVILNPWVEQNCEGPDLALLKTTPTFFVVTRLQGTTCNGDGEYALHAYAVCWTDNQARV